MDGLEFLETELPDLHIKAQSHFLEIFEEILAEAEALGKDKKTQRYARWARAFQKDVHHTVHRLTKFKSKSVTSIPTIASCCVVHEGHPPPNKKKKKRKKPGRNG